MDADEILRLVPGFGQAGDRQRGGVGAEDHIGAEHGLRLLGHIGLDLAGFEHRFDDQIAAGQIGIIGRRVDAIEDGLRLVSRGLLFGEAISGVLLALVGGFLRGVEQHHFDAGLSRDHGDAGAHQAGAEHGDLLRWRGRHLFRAARALFGGLLGNEQAADHVGGLRIGDHLGEIFAFDADGGVHRQLGAFIHRAEDGARRVHVVAGIHVRHRGAANENLREIGVERRCRPAGHLEILGVPRLHTAGRIGFHPRLGTRHDLVRRGDFLRHAKAQGFLRAHVLALEQIHQRRLDAHQARQALGAARAGEQANHDFRQAQRDLGIVGNHAVMAGEDEFEPAAQRQAIHGRRHRLAAGFQIAQQAVEAEHAIEQRRHSGLAFWQRSAPK